jgi:hypothetical protein
MKSKFFTTLIVLVILASSALTVWAGLHFSGGAGFGSGSIVIDAELAGISGGRSATVTATVTSGAGLTAVCRNKGGNIAYGQNAVNVTGLSASQTVSPDRNGSATVHFRINLTQGVSARAAGCPNGNWKVTDLLGGVNVNLTATDGRFTDSQNYSCFVSEVDSIVACTPLD